MCSFETQFNINVQLSPTSSSSDARHLFPGIVSGVSAYSAEVAEDLSSFMLE